MCYMRAPTTCGLRAARCHPCKLLEFNFDGDVSGRHPAVGMGCIHHFSEIRRPSLRPERPCRAPPNPEKLWCSGLYALARCETQWHRAAARCALWRWHFNKLGMLAAFPIRYHSDGRHQSFSLGLARPRAQSRVRARLATQMIWEKLAVVVKRSRWSLG